MKKYIDELTDQGDTEKIDELNYYEFSVIIMPIKLIGESKKLKFFNPLMLKLNL